MYSTYNDDRAENICHVKGITWGNSDTSTTLTMMTEQRTFVMKGVTWANSGTCTALTMMTEQRTFVMKGVTWANSDKRTALTVLDLGLISIGSLGPRASTKLSPM